MGPFVPDLISDQLNLLFAFFIGIMFGFVLEQAGFSSSRRLAGVFYGYDFTVLRVFFTAGITAILGVILLGFFGLLDLSAIYINPLWLLPAIVGGIIMGIGFILGGYCPGTSICAVAIGKVDAMFFVAGGLAGAFLFGEFFPTFESFYESTAFGPVKVYESLGIPQGFFVLALTVVAVSAFFITTRIERRVNPTEAPSRAFHPLYHFLGAGGVLTLAVLVFFLPPREEWILNNVSKDMDLRSHTVPTMTADELAFRILDQDPKIQIVDVRPSEQYAAQALPGSMNFTFTGLLGKDPRVLFSKSKIKKIVVGTNDRESKLGALLLMENGITNVVALQGGMEQFEKTILTPDASFVPRTRWDHDIKQFRLRASQEIHRMINESKNKVQVVRVVKKIKGGC